MSVLLVPVTSHRCLEVLPGAPAIGTPLLRFEKIEPHEVLLDPPRSSGSEARLDLILGLLVTAAPEEDTEGKGAKTAEDLEKEDHRITVRPFPPTPRTARPDRLRE
jgi:hypothetical protein